MRSFLVFLAKTAGIAIVILFIVTFGSILDNFVLTEHPEKLEAVQDFLTFWEGN